MTVLLHFDNRRFSFRGHSEQIDVLLNVSLSNRGREQNHQDENTNDTPVSLYGDVNEDIKGLEGRMFWLF